MYIDLLNTSSKSMQHRTPVATTSQLPWDKRTAEMQRTPEMHNVDNVEERRGNAVDIARRYYLYFRTIYFLLLHFLFVGGMWRIAYIPRIVCYVYILG